MRIMLKRPWIRVGGTVQIGTILEWSSLSQPDYDFLVDYDLAKPLSPTPEENESAPIAGPKTVPDGLGLTRDDHEEPEVEDSHGLDEPADSDQSDQ